jgi:Ras family protein A
LTVPASQGEEVAKKIGAYKYVECSAVLNQGVHEVFEHAARAVIFRAEEKRKEKRIKGRVAGLRNIFTKSSA